MRKLETRVQVICYLIVVEKRRGRVSQQRETDTERGDQRQTDSDRDGEVEKQRKNEGDTYVKRDSVFGGVRSISLLLRCQLYFNHLHFLMFSSNYYPPVYCSRLLFCHLHLSVFPLTPRTLLVTDIADCQPRDSQAVPHASQTKCIATCLQ